MSYASLAQARAEGITTQQADDTRLQLLLDNASRYIDAVTGLFFEPRTRTLRFSGNGEIWLALPAPVITLTGVTLDDGALALADVIVDGLYTDEEHQRRNPRLARKPSSFQYGADAARWPEGLQNITVAGSFGFVEANGTSAPPAIQEVCLRLALRNLARLGDASGQASRQASRVYREATDGHSYELAGGIPGAAGAWRQGGLTGDADIDVTLAMYGRAPGGAMA